MTCCFTGHRILPKDKEKQIFDKTREVVVGLIEKGVMRLTNEPNSITSKEITSYLKMTISWSQRTVASTICNLKQFLSYLYKEKYT